MRHQMGMFVNSSTPTSSSRQSGHSNQSGEATSQSELHPKTAILRPLDSTEFHPTDESLALARIVHPPSVDSTSPLDNHGVAESGPQSLMQTLMTSAKNLLKRATECEAAGKLREANVLGWTTCIAWSFLCIAWCVYCATWLLYPKCVEPSNGVRGHFAQGSSCEDVPEVPVPKKRADMFPAMLRYTWAPIVSSASCSEHEDVDASSTTCSENEGAR